MKYATIILALSLATSVVAKDDDFTDSSPKVASHNYNKIYLDAINSKEMKSYLANRIAKIDKNDHLNDRISVNVQIKINHFYDQLRHHNMKSDSVKTQELIDNLKKNGSFRDINKVRQDYFKNKFRHKL